MSIDLALNHWILYRRAVVRSYRYRLMPTRAQEETLLSWLSLTRELYNAALQERRDAWRKQGVGVHLNGQLSQLPDVRVNRPEYLTIPIAVLRGALRRLDRAFKNFFRRCKSGETPGYPRFKGPSAFSSISIDDLYRVRRGQPMIVAGGKRVQIEGLGRIKIKQHRPLQGVPKALRIKLDGDGHWYATFACVDVPAELKPATGREVGVDLGLTTFAATSDGEAFANPRPMSACRIGVERAARRVARRERGSNRRRKAVRHLARKKFHEAQVRRQHHIDVANTLVVRYDTIYVEALNVHGLARGMLAKSVNDAGWGGFLHWLRVKAESAGREVIEVNPAGTSQTCSECGCEVRKGLSVRVHRCPHCGYVADRDVNAARNILSAGRALRREAVAAGTPRRPEKVAEAA